MSTSISTVSSDINEVKANQRRLEEMLFQTVALSKAPIAPPVPAPAASVKSSDSDNFRDLEKLANVFKVFKEVISCDKSLTQVSTPLETESQLQRAKALGRESELEHEKAVERLKDIYHEKAVERAKELEHAKQLSTIHIDEKEKAAKLENVETAKLEAQHLQRQRELLFIQREQETIRWDTRRADERERDDIAYHRRIESDHLHYITYRRDEFAHIENLNRNSTHYGRHVYPTHSSAYPFSRYQPRHEYRGYYYDDDDNGRSDSRRDDNRRRLY
jgi:hypothetical protein